jgi:hypothetical protein
MLERTDAQHGILDWRIKASAAIAEHSSAFERLMSIQHQEAGQETDQPQEKSEEAGKTLASPGSPGPALDTAKVRRRALLVALSILVLLLLAGFGDALGNYLPHTTPPFDNGQTQLAGNLRVTLQFTPNPPKASGDPATLVAITLQGSDGQAVDGARVQISLMMVTMDMGVNETTAQALGQGHYQAKVAFLMPGAWQVTVTVTPVGGASASIPYAVDVAS